MEIPVQIGVHGNIALGVFHITHRQNDTPIIAIMCYGLNGDRVEQHRMSVKTGRFAELNNINFMRMDYCNQGVSEGSFINVTITSKINDIVHLIKEVNGYFGHKKIDIYLIGFSDGSRVAVNVASICDEIKGIILWNPIINIPDIENEPANSNKKNEKIYIDKETRRLYKKILGVKLNIATIKEMNSDNTYGLIKNYRKPVLYIFGSNDRFTKLLQESINDIGLYDTMKDSKHTVKDSNHIFPSTYFENEVINITINWIKDKSFIF